jgi:hypothetical protein
MKSFFVLTFAILGLVGCGTPSNPQAERGPNGTIAYNVTIDSSEPGASIEVNGESVGVTPMVLKIFGDRDGTFHNFGSYDFILQGYPPGKGRPSQNKIYHTGALMGQEDKIPGKIYFDFGPKSNSTNP